jgi:hypothetical protein
MKLKVIILSVGYLLLAGLCFGFGTANQQAESISLMQLIVNPEKYNGKLVQVIGIANIEFEDNGIFFTKEHYLNRIYKNALWIEPNYDALGATPEQLQKYNGEYVLMEGIFDMNHKGHFGAFSRALTKITRYQLWLEYHHQGDSIKSE